MFLFYIYLQVTWTNDLQAAPPSPPRQSGDLKLQEVFESQGLKPQAMDIWKAIQDNKKTLGKL